MGTLGERPLLAEVLKKSFSPDKRKFGELGGAGGAGCVGLGGSQNSARNGPDGSPGANGTSGTTGTTGRNGTASLRLVAFEHVAKERQKAGGDKDRFVGALRKMQE
jgi:hypothetical protein